MLDLEVQNKVLARRIYDELWNQQKLEVAIEIFEHPEGVERFVKEFLGAFPDLQHTVEEMIAEGSQVVVRFTARGTQLGEWKQFPASGKKILYTGVTIATVERNKITQHHTWWDTLEVIEQITDN